MHLDDWLQHIARQHTQQIDMGLARMAQMVRQLGLQSPAPHVVTVAGTNGKGTTCLATEALLLAAGQRVGTTLSPHLHVFNERIRIDGELVDDITLCQAFSAIEDARAGLPLTYFEFGALAALWCFVDKGVDVAILEIGLGGRLDAFNVIDADVAVITHIGLDHQAYLGDTEEQIGREKAGILRAGQRVVLGPDMPASVTARCAELGVAPLVFGQDVALRSMGPEQISISMHIDARECAFTVATPNCIAAQNLSLAMVVAELLRGPLSQAVIDTATTGLAVPGRMERVDYAERHWLFDVAHNPTGIAFLVNELQQRGVQPDGIVCGMLADKAHEAVLAHARDAWPEAKWFVVSTDGERGMTGVALAEHLKGVTPIIVPPEAELIPSICSATQPGDVILTFGSFSVVEQCRIGCHLV